MDKFNVSIIIPIFNVSKYIERCAITLFSQSFESIQYIFVNDCTPDNSIDLLTNITNNFPERKNSIQIINHDFNRGLASARKTGYNFATGDYILHIDSDDYLELNMVEEMYKKAISTNADIVVCDFYMQWNKKHKYYSQDYSAIGIEYSKMLLSFDVMPNVWNKLIKKSLIDKSGISSIEGINTGEDYLLMPKLASFANSVSKVNLALYHYNQVNVNSYMKSYSKKSIENLIQVIELLSIFFEKRIEFKEALLIGKLRVKIQMLQAANIKDRKYLYELFPETISIDNSSKLKLQGKITIWLTNNKYFVLLDLFIFLYLKAYYYKNQILRRN